MSVALKAAELLELKGFGQGTYEGKGDCLCIFGALIEAAVPAHPYSLEDPIHWDSWFLRQKQLNKEHKDVVAAVRKAIEETGWESCENAAVTAMLTEQGLYDDNQSFIVYWNDETGRTKEQVVAVLKRADEILESK